MKHNILIWVNDLEQSRYFYRETLGLGEPLTDSCEMAAFALSEEAMLVLQKSCAEYLEHASGAVSWIFFPEDFDRVCAVLKKNGHWVDDNFSFPGCRGFRACDPEGNIFIVAEKR